MSRDDLVERLANGVLMQSAELRNLATRVEKSVDALHEVKRLASDAIDKYEALAHQCRLAIGESNKQLAVISKDVDDVERVAREATGAHQLAAAHEGHAGLLAAWGALSARSQIILALVLLAALFGGGAGHWLLSHIGK